MRRLQLGLAFVASTFLLAAAPIVLPDGVSIQDVQTGKAATAQAGQIITVHYSGWLYVDGARGLKFDSSLDRGQPFTFQLGVGQVIEGWDTGIIGMNVGGKRTLIIPAHAAYGDEGAGADIPPGATLIFDVELISVE
jgi:FKBP-type peptidyl-prolyl cis-trans isomerase